jgi:hypothetical protein
VQGGQALSNSSQNEAAVIDAGASDFMLTCDVTPQNYSTFAERDPDIVFRWTDANNFWLVRVTSAGQALELAEMAGGVYSVHVSQHFSRDLASWWPRRLFDMGETMTLIEVIRDLKSFDNEGIICATKPWTDNSAAIVVVEPGARTLPAEAARLGMEYFLDIFVAREFLEGWGKSLGANPSLQEQCARLIQYAVNDA